MYSKYGPYDYSSYNGRLGDVVRHPVAQKKHQMFGKRYLHDQSTAPNMPQQANGTSVPIPPQSEMPIKYEFDPYPGHHPLANGLDGPTSSVQLQVIFENCSKQMAETISTQGNSSICIQ